MKSFVFHLVMAILEGGLSGVILYQAEKEEEKKRKILLLISSIGWFILSLTDSWQSIHALKEAKMTETNGGDNNE